MRKEKDPLGEMNIPDDALYGIHSLRARENFPDKTPFHSEWYQAMATVKRACYLTATEFLGKARERYPDIHKKIKTITPRILSALIESATECEKGEYYGHFIVPAISGGAGTSINMNINEIITNTSLAKLGMPYGTYDQIDPVEHANIFQSTNDVVPTALRVAVMRLLGQLEESINTVRSNTENLENKHRNDLRIAYTQMQEAVPSTFGRLFSAYSDALSRDWWRISKCFERIKVVNLGGSAIGTALTVPNYFASEVVKTLQRITDLPVTRGENLSDVTSNLDPFVEIHGILKAHAVNLEKIVNDLRLLASDIRGNSEIQLPGKQVGSSVMPGKINPVIPEFVISSVHRIYSNDSLIVSLAAQGCLELNAYLPVIGHALIESLKLLIACDVSIADHLLDGLVVNTEIARDNLYRSPSITTALLPYLGYNRSGEIARYMREQRVGIFEANQKLHFLNENKLNKILQPENLVKAGYHLKDLLED